MFSSDEQGNHHDVQSMWDRIEYGRAPDPDYTEPLPRRQARNRQRAQLAFEKMVSSPSESVKIDEVTLTCLMNVYAESLRDKEAEEVLAMFPKYGVQPTSLTYRSLIRMHIRKRNMKAALSTKELMKRSNIQVCGASYGILIEALTHRGDLPLALKLLEDATTEGSARSIPDKNIRQLRARCNKLGVCHPDMPSDPHEWVKHMKKLRRPPRTLPKGE